MRSYKEDDLTPWRGVPWTVRCQLFSILYQRIVANVARGALISYVFELLIFRTLTLCPRMCQHLGGVLWLLRCWSFVYSILVYHVHRNDEKNYIQTTREFSEGRWGLDVSNNCNRGLSLQVKKGEPDDVGRYGNHSLHLAMLPSRKSIWFCIVTFRPGRPPPAQRWGTKENYNSIYLVIMVKKSFANRWLLVCLYNGPSLWPTMLSMANDIEMIKMREEWGSSLDLLFSPTRSRYARPRDGNKRLAEKSHKIFRVLFEFYRASISRD